MCLFCGFWKYLQSYFPRQLVGDTVSVVTALFVFCTKPNTFKFSSGSLDKGAGLTSGDKWHYDGNLSLMLFQLYCTIFSNIQCGRFQLSAMLSGWEVRGPRFLHGYSEVSQELKRVQEAEMWQRVSVACFLCADIVRKFISKKADTDTDRPLSWVCLYRSVTLSLNSTVCFGSWRVPVVRTLLMMLNLFM